MPMPFAELDDADKFRLIAAGVVVFCLVCCVIVSVARNFFSE